MKYILIVEDEMLIRFALAEALRDSETEIIAVPDAESALKTLGSWPFRFCFLDIHLPDRSGLEIMNIVRQLCPTTRIILMTGSEIDAQAMALVREQAYLFLKKPFDLFWIKRVLNSIPEEDENIFHEVEEIEARLGERRRSRRQAAAKNIQYALKSSRPSGPERYQNADLLDISDAGTRIRTSSHLQPGSVLQFLSSMNNAAGIVRWSEADKQKDRYLAGIQFVDRVDRGQT